MVSTEARPSDSVDIAEPAQGISGGPVLDEIRQQVIGMMATVVHPDATTKHRDTGFATPTETLRQVIPELRITVFRASH